MKSLIDYDGSLGGYKKSDRKQKDRNDSCHSETGRVKKALLVLTSGQIPGDYHEEIKTDNYGKWLAMKLIQNLPPQSVLVIDNERAYTNC